MKRLIMVTLVTAALSATSLITQAEDTLITIGTGGSNGVYYVVGQSICRLMNRDTGVHGLRCNAPPSGGSVANIEALRSNGQDLAVAQSDMQFHALNGTEGFEEAGAFEELRSIFSIHPEPFTVVARTDSNISSFEDLKGKRVNIGNPGSGQRGTLEVLLEALEWTLEDFGQTVELKSTEQAQALGDDNVDAIIFTVGHPNGSIQEATTITDTVLVPVVGPAIDALVAEHSYYAAATIPGGMYRGNEEDTQTFGVGATLITRADVPEEVIYQVVKTVFDNFERFQRLHPVFATLDPQQMISTNLSAPLHPGAERYYREQGWL